MVRKYNFRREKYLLLNCWQPHLECVGSCQESRDVRRWPTLMMLHLWDLVRLKHKVIWLIWLQDQCLRIQKTEHQHGPFIPAETVTQLADYSVGTFIFYITSFMFSHFIFLSICHYLFRNSLQIRGASCITEEQLLFHYQVMKCTLVQKEWWLQIW